MEWVSAAHTLHPTSQSPQTSPNLKFLFSVALWPSLIYSSSTVCSSALNPTPKLCTEMILGAQQSLVESSLRRHLSDQCKLFGQNVILNTHRSPQEWDLHHVTNVCPNAFNCTSILTYIPNPQLHWAPFIHTLNEYLLRTHCGDIKSSPDFMELTHWATHTANPPGLATLAPLLARDRMRLMSLKHSLLSPQWMGLS